MVKFDGEMTRGDIFNIYKKTPTNTITVNWVCKKKINHKIQLKKGEILELVNCETNKRDSFAKWNGNRFVYV